MDPIEKLARGILDFLKFSPENKYILIVLFCIAGIVSLIIFVFPTQSSPHIIIALISLTLVVVIIFGVWNISRLSKAADSQLRMAAQQEASVVHVGDLSTGLMKFKEWYTKNDIARNKKGLILWRIMPAEFTEHDYALPRDNSSRELITWYKNLVESFVVDKLKSSSATDSTSPKTHDINGWDTTLYSRLDYSAMDVHDYQEFTKRVNKSTYDHILKTYFNKQPKTSELGLLEPSPTYAWEFILMAADDEENDPIEYLCYLRWDVGAHKRPSNGQFVLQQSIIRNAAFRFRDLKAAVVAQQAFFNFDDKSNDNAINEKYETEKQNFRDKVIQFYDDRIITH